MLPGLAFAQTSAPRVHELDEVVISAPSAADTLRMVPHSVSVITREDIDSSPSLSVAELLGREANLNLISYFGHDKNATIGMRGFGESAANNVLVMVDGVRLNADDLSGADLSTVAVSQIKRIEVLRGGGAVRYGDGAVGGVIHVLTNGPSSTDVRSELSLRTAAYGTQALQFSTSGGHGPVSASVEVERMSSDGYRQHDEQRRTRTAVAVRWSPGGTLAFMDLLVRFSRHLDEYGLPGEVSREDFLSGESARRRASRSPRSDGGQTDDRKMGLLWRVDLGDAGVFEFQLDHRRRENPFLIGVDADTQRNAIDSTREDAQLRYDLDFTLFGLPQNFGMGVASQSSDYLSQRRGTAAANQSERFSGDLNGQAWYVEGVTHLSRQVRMNAGWRRDETKSRTTRERYISECVFIPIPVPPFVMPGPCVSDFRRTGSDSNTWRNDAAEFGVTWNPIPSLTTFVSASRHFRNPNIDELALASSDLRAQRGRTIEAGVRLQPDDRLSLGLTLFRLRNQDEIYFDSTGVPSVNRNYDLPTQRTGVELETRWQPSAAWLFAANAGYVQPRFKGTDADIPLVPRWTANARAEWLQTPSLRWIVAARHAGRRFDGNDLDNRSFAELPSYTVFDLALRLDLGGGAQLAAGINNVFDKVYSTIAFSETYYPMPERNGYASLRWRF
ncbi:TonB-dependent receptor [Methyloversatilis sp.]|uniref:TonB-dependent receptor n=1 Tax=Methyloversatilis sp. TaxID=2569862 RepID=UPI0027371CF7|nr:TonB-dependent receptor [Methyloversatilis sp.]